MKYATFLTCSAVALGSFAAHANLEPISKFVGARPQEAKCTAYSSDRERRSGEFRDRLLLVSPVEDPTIEVIDTNNIHEGVSIVRDLINLGKEAWQLVENSKPSITIDEPFDSHSASAVPEGIKHFSEMSYWKGPASKVYKIRWTAAGLEYASFSYRITYQYGGKYQGAGQYLKNVTVIPEEIHMPWGYTFNSAVSVVDPINHGSQTDPLAGLQVVIRYSIGNAFGKQESRRTHMIRGDGAIVELK